MNNEQQELLNEVYENYVKWWEESDDSCNLTEEQYSKWLKLVDGGLQWAPLTKEEFINKCKTNPEFSEKWGLKIEERELSEGERGLLLQPLGLDPLTKEGRDRLWKENNLPTKLITITHNNKTIESYK
jgi:hypothetical protein